MRSSLPGGCPRSRPLTDAGRSVRIREVRLRTRSYSEGMNTIDSIALEVSDLTVAEAFYAQAFDLGSRLQLRQSDAPSSGFRGYTLSLITAQPANAQLLFDDAVTAGAEVLKPAAKSLWGFGGAVRSPDGAVWNFATSSKKDAEPASRTIESIVLLLGAEDVKASKA